MKDYVIKRILLFIPTLIIITMITFLVCRLAPGDPTEMKLGQTGEAQKTDAKNLMTEQAKEFYKKKFGLDKPLPMKYSVFYADLHDCYSHRYLQRCKTILFY